MPGLASKGAQELKKGRERRKEKPQLPTLPAWTGLALALCPDR